MKVGLPASIALHTALLAWAVLSLPGASETAPAVDAMPVEFVPISEARELRLGQKTAKPKEEIVARDAAKAAKESEGQRAGASKQEEPPPAPPEVKPQVAALPKEEPKPAPPPPPRPPEPKPVAKPEPPKEEPKPERPKEAEKAKEVGEGKPPEAKEPPKDQKALDKIIEKAEKEPPKPAEKKPEPPKAPEKRPEPVRTASTQPAQASTVKSQFDARNIADILNRNQTGSSAAPEARTASLGAPSGRNAAVRMTQTEMDALMGQIQKCWNPPIGAAEARLKVVLRFGLAQDGSLVGRPVPVEAPAHPLGLSLARSAERAVIQCGPYRLPAEKYSAWSDVIATFDPNNL